MPNVRHWLIVGVIVLIYSAIALPLGLGSGFLSWSFTPSKPLYQLAIILRTLIFPALTEEIAFRVLPLPHSLEVIS